jgi:hypothetical protein
LNTQYSCNNWEYPKSTATLAYKNKQETAWTPILVSSHRTKKTKKKGKEMLQVQCSRRKCSWQRKKISIGNIKKKMRSEGKNPSDILL